MDKIPETIIVGINNKVLFCCQQTESPLTDTFYLFGKNYYLSSKNYGANSRQGKHAVIYSPDSGEQKTYRIRIWFSDKEIDISPGSYIEDIISTSGGFTNITSASGGINDISPSRQLIYDQTHKFDIYDTIHIKSIDKKISISTRKLILFNNEVELDAILIINTD